MENLVPQLDDPGVQRLLGLAVYPDPVRLQQTCARYRSEPRWVLLGYRQHGAVVGCIGLEMEQGGRAVIRHIAVLPEVQRRGAARAMIEHVRRTYQLTRLEAETHTGATGFYERCGFGITSLGERYPGVERFRCVWEAGTDASAGFFETRSIDLRRDSPRPFV